MIDGRIVERVDVAKLGEPPGPERRDHHRRHTSENDSRADSEQCCSDAALEGAELVGRPNENVLHGRDPAAHVIRRGQRHERGADEHADRIGSGEHDERSEGDGIGARGPEHDRHRPEHTDGDEEYRADAAAHRPNRQESRHDDSANSRRGSQPAVANVADLQSVLGNRREQSHRTAEQHGEEVEGDRPEEDRSTSYEAQALERVMESGRLVGRGTHLRAAIADGERGDRSEAGEDRRRGVGRGRVELVQQAAGGRPDDHADLPGCRVQGDQPG